MALSTILVHLNDRRRAPRLVRVAMALGRPSAARIIGLHVYSGMPPVAPVVVPYGDDVIAAVREAEEREAHAIETAFAGLTAPVSDRAEWVCERSAGPDLANHVMRYGRSADVIVASIADPQWDMAPVLDFPERLAMESGRPVLLVPNDGDFDTPPTHAVLAWNGSREAARAGFDALHVLPAGLRITVLVIDDMGVAAGSHKASAAAFAKTATRHGFKCAVATRELSGRTIGEALLSECAALDGNLLVMGAYGHSRFREFVFGGATRYVTHRATVPTLLSH